MNKAVSEATFWMPKGASTVAGDVDALYYFIYWLSVVLFIGIVGAMTYFVFHYKRKAADEIPYGPHHSTTLEVTWTVIPLILVLVIFVWGFKGYMKMAVVPGDAMTINVTAQQWQWSFTYPNGVTNADDERKDLMPTAPDKDLAILRVPAGKPVKLVMRSLDVLHSFWIPEFRIKHDIVPGQYSTVWFQALEPGDYRAFCTEYCGRDHSMMMAMVQAMPPAEYDAWLKKTKERADAAQSPVDVGRRALAKNACAGCHSSNGSPMAGPTFKGLFGKKEELADGSMQVVDEQYLRESILQPRAKLVKGYAPVMPENFKDQLSEVEITGLIEFIKTLK